MSPHISLDQAREVALRLAPGDGRTVRFTADGSVVPTIPAVEQALERSGRQVFACSRTGGSLQVTQVLPRTQVPSAA